MNLMKNAGMLVAGLFVFAAFAPMAVAADTVAATLRANTAAWAKAYNAGNADAVARCTRTTPWSCRRGHLWLAVTQRSSSIS